MLRRLGGWLLVVLGVVLALLGVAGAIVVGPDNAVRSGVRDVDSPGAAIVTAPGLLGIAGPTLRLEATSAAGPVFIGAGAEVDVEDLTAKVTHTQVDDIDVLGGGLETSEVQGDQDFLADVGDLDWWIESAEGDEAVIAFALPKHPISVVVMNADGSSPVDAKVAAELSIRGLFWGLLATALIGVGLLNVGVLVLVRARARRRAGSATDDPVAAPVGKDPT